MRKVPDRLILIVFLAVIVLSSSYSYAQVRSNIIADEGMNNEQNNVSRDAKNGLNVEVRDNQLSVDLVNAQFRSVIKAIAEKSGFTVVLSSRTAGGKITTKFADIDLERGIMRLLQLVREKNYMFHYDTKGMISKLEIFGGTPGSPGFTSPEMPKRRQISSPKYRKPAVRRTLRSPAPRSRTSRGQPNAPRELENKEEGLHSK
jgi:hypothetical protein